MYRKHFVEDRNNFVMDRIHFVMDRKKVVMDGKKLVMDGKKVVIGRTIVVMGRKKVVMIPMGHCNNVTLKYFSFIGAVQFKETYGVVVKISSVKNISKQLGFRVRVFTHSQTLVMSHSYHCRQEIWCGCQQKE